MSIISGITHDAQTRLDVRSSEVVGTGLYRPNVRLEVIRVDGEANKRRKLVELLNRLRGPGFVSAAGPKAVDDLTAYLADWGVPVAGFHDKLPGKRREIAEDRFLACELKALIAASGSEPPIEGATLRYLVHYHPPTSLDAFVREIGHVGRDGRPAVSVLLYDPADQKFQRSFRSPRLPEDDDLVATYHALERFDDKPEPPTLDDVAAVCPVPKTRIRACLHLLGWRGYVRTEPGGRYRVAVPYLGRDALMRAGWAFRERQERDRANRGRVVAYAEGSGCRWQTLLDHFDSDPLPAGCGRCDVCG